MKKGKVIAAVRKEAKERQYREFEALIASGESVSAASQAAGITYHDGRRLASRVAAEHWGTDDYGRSVAEAGAMLRDFYVRRIEEIENELAEAKSRRDSIPDSPELAAAWARMEREIRDMRSERAGCEERLAVLAAHVPSLAEVAELAPKGLPDGMIDTPDAVGGEGA